MRPLSFKIISWAKLEVSALFQSHQHVRNMFSYKNVNGTKNARPKGSKKSGNFQKSSFYPKMMDMDGYFVYRRSTLKGHIASNKFYVMLYDDFI